MNKTGIIAAVPQAVAVSPAPGQIGARSIRRTHPLYRILSVAASLRVTVVLFVLSFFLIFFGTLALKDEGLNTVLHKYFRNPGIAEIPVQIFARFGQVFFGLAPDTYIRGAFYYPGGWLLGGLLLINLLAAHATRFKCTWKRSGVLILHAGVIVMMLGEGVTGVFAVESRMTIPEHQSANYLEDHNLTELAIIQHSSAAKDKVVVIPGSLLRQNEGEVIRDEALPFDVKVVQYLVNSKAPSRIAAKAPNKANAGDGRTLEVVKTKESGGTGSDTDIASAYVTILKKGTDKPLGTYLVSVWWSGYWISGLLERPQTVNVGDKTYDLMLRFKRTQKDYTIHLREFHHDVYIGTDVPKNFSSRIVLVDPRTSDERDVVISMNNPLHYGGETFYQSGFLPEDRGTILQVVENPGSLMPYIACVMVALGMLVHFSLHLFTFLDKIRLSRLDNAEQEPFLARAFPMVVIGTAAAFLIYWAWPPQESSDRFHYYQLGEIPVVDHGRVKPLDTVARTSLTIISNRPFFNDEDDKRQPAIKWLLDVMTCDHNFQERKVFYIPSPELRKFYKLEDAPDFRYSLADIVAAFPQLGSWLTFIAKAEEEALEGLSPARLDSLREVQNYLAFGRYDSAHRVFRIENDQVLDLLGLKARHGFRYAFTEFAGTLPKLIKQAYQIKQEIKDNTLDEKTLSVYQAKLLDVFRHVELYLGLAQLSGDTLRVVPPSPGNTDWLEFGKALRAKPVPPTARALSNLLDDYSTKNVSQLNSDLEAYLNQLREEMPANIDKAAFECYFNRFEPFFLCTCMYLTVFLLVLLSWLAALFAGYWVPLNRAAFWLAILTLAIHSAGLFGRMYLMGRAFVFVTNLYSSAIFIGWGCVLVGLILERIYRIGVGTVLAAVLGFLSLQIADYLGQSGDTLEMMQAVLDTSFWLATHVTAVAIGYVATFVAGFLGMIFIGLMVASAIQRYFDGDRSLGVLSDRLMRILGQMIYGVVCFATLFSFTGTVLGGIWADQSWGRFWGWDPKENGALLIVLWNALILHARWAGIVKQRGMAVLTVAGNMVTGWSWFGTNQLGVGLHAYGFNNTLATGLVIFWATQLVFIAFGCMPRRLWQPRPEKKEPPLAKAKVVLSPKPHDPQGRSLRR